MNYYLQNSSVSNMLSYLNNRFSLKALNTVQMLHKIVYNQVDVSLPSYVTYKHTLNAATKLIDCRCLQIYFLP